MRTLSIHFHDRKRQLPWLFVFFGYRKNFVGTKKRVRISHGKWAIGIRATEVDWNKRRNYEVFALFFFFFYFYWCDEKWKMVAIEDLEKSKYIWTVYGLLSNQMPGNVLCSITSLTVVISFHMYAISLFLMLPFNYKSILIIIIHDILLYSKLFIAFVFLESQ